MSHWHYQHKLIGRKELENRTPAISPPIPSNAAFHHKEIPCRAPVWSSNQNQAPAEIPQKDRLAKMKTYADNRNHHKASIIQVGDMVLFRHKRKNKLSSRYNPQLVRVIQKKESMVTIKKPDDSPLTRNTSHVKKIPTRATQRWRNISEDSEEENEENEDNQEIQNEAPEQQTQNRRPARQRQRPNYLGDFVMD